MLGRPRLSLEATLLSPFLSAVLHGCAPGCGTFDSALDFLLFFSSLSPNGFQFVVQQQHSQKQQK